MPGATEAQSRGAQAAIPRRGSHGLLQALASRLRRVPPAAQGGTEGASLPCLMACPRPFVAFKLDLKAPAGSCCLCRTAVVASCKPA